MRLILAYIRYFWRQSNTLLILLCATCSVLGILLVYSAEMSSGFTNQLIASAGGIFLALCISQLDYHLLCHLWPAFLLPALLLIVLTFTPLGFNAAGTDDTAWLGLPFGSRTPFITFQPSEFLKIAFIITFSKHLDKAKEHFNRFINVLLLCAHAALPITLVFLQGDDGTAVVFMCMTAIMLFAAGLHWGYFAGVTAITIPASVILWRTLDEQKLGRIMALIHPEKYLDTYGWQQHRALISIGNGGLWGTGYQKGGAVPLFARNNDFIFTEAAEEFGLLGALLLLGLLLCVIAALLFAALHAKDALGAYLCVGMAGLIASQAVINVGMNLRLVPVIGITLPFFSAGGSAVLALYLGIGLALGVCFQSNANDKRHIFARRYKNGISPW